MKDITHPDGLLQVGELGVLLVDILDLHEPVVLNFLQLVIDLSVLAMVNRVLERPSP